MAELRYTHAAFGNLTIHNICQRAQDMGRIPNDLVAIREERRTVPGLYSLELIKMILHMWRCHRWVGGGLRKYPFPFNCPKLCVADS